MNLQMFDSTAKADWGDADRSHKTGEPAELQVAVYVDRWSKARSAQAHDQVRLVVGGRSLELNRQLVVFVL